MIYLFISFKALALLEIHEELKKREIILKLFLHEYLFIQGRDFIESSL